MSEGDLGLGGRGGRRGKVDLSTSLSWKSRMALKQSPARNLSVTKTEEWMHWMLFNAVDVAGVVAFVIIDNDMGARGEPTVLVIC